MNFENGNIYHVYNRGNEKQQIFFTNANYNFFLRKIEKYVQPNCDILAWCLMPNHFHFLIHANEKSCAVVTEKPFPIYSLVNGLRLLLSSYTKAINVQQSRTGNLFQQKTKSKSVSQGKEDYSAIAFHYIHQNPLKAKLVDKIEDWQYSSFRDYARLRAGSICNAPLAFELLGLTSETFLHNSSLKLDERKVSEIFER